MPLSLSILFLNLFHFIRIYFMHQLLLPPLMFFWSSKYLSALNVENSRTLNTNPCRIQVKVSTLLKAICILNILPSFNHLTSHVCRSIPSSRNFHFVPQSWRWHAGIIYCCLLLLSFHWLSSIFATNYETRRPWKAKLNNKRKKRTAMTLEKKKKHD